MGARVLLVSASAGGGHGSAARALERAFAERHPAIETRHVDILDFTAAAFKKIYAQSYLLLADRLPALWGYLYAHEDARRLERRKARVLQVFDRIHYRRFRALVEEFGPRHMLCTHFLPAEILDPRRWEAEFRVPLSLVVTDYDVHAYWVHPGASRHFVATEELKARLAARGIDPARIEVTGIPIDPAFTREPDREAVRARHGLRPGVFTPLVMGGGFGMKGLARTTAEVLALGPPLQVVVVCGRNRRALAEVSSLRPGEGVALRALGFVDHMPDLMAAADVAVTKSGGLTVSECLARRLPMIVHSPVPGQEERNADFLLEAGAALKAADAVSLRHKLGLLRREPQRLARLSEGAAAAARPGAASAVADSIAREVAR